MQDTRLPVTVPSGFLEAGKTTLLNRVSITREARLNNWLVRADATIGPHDVPDYHDPFPVWRPTTEAA